MYSEDDFDRALIVLGRIRREIEPEATHAGQTMLAWLERAGVDPEEAWKWAQEQAAIQDDDPRVREIAQGAWLHGLMVGVLMAGEAPR